ncbi:MAG: phosphotransferase, partial [Clostridia bacterium]
VIKLFDKDYSKSDVFNEALNQSRVEETELNIPKIQQVTNVDGKWAIVMDYVKGKGLDRLMLQELDKIDYYLNLFVDLQLQMQNHKAPLLNKLIDKMDRKISESSFDASTRYELHTRLHGMTKQTKLCHGDFCPSNIIIGEDGRNYILDWSHATQGNGSADAARTYLLFKLQKQEEIANKYLKLYCNKSDTAKQEIDKWLPIVAASQSVKGKKEEREFLSKWVNVVEFE